MSDPIGSWAAALHGRLLGGKYRLGPLIGRGGMGAVFRGEDRALGRPVAIKLIHPGRRDSGQRIERFRREARAAALVGGDGVVAVLDFDFDADLGPYQVLELLDGETLGARLERGPVPPGEAMAIALEVATTLARVHRAGIVHRDIKPANVFLERLDAGGARVKILDFGVASIEASEELTLPGSAIGTPGFMAPEQIRDHGVDARTDLYALGMLLHTCVMGSPPFAGLERADVAVQTLDGTLPSLRARAPHLPEALLACVEASSAVEPLRRPADAQAFAAMLGGQIAAPISVPPAPADLASDTPLASTLLSDVAAPAARSIPDTGDPDPERAPFASPAPMPAPIPTERATPTAAIAVVLAVVLLAGGAAVAGAWYFTRSPAAVPRSESATTAPPAEPDVPPSPEPPPPAVDAVAARVRAAADAGEAQLRAGGVDGALSTFSAVRDDAWSLPAGPERRALVTRIQIGIGDAHRALLEQTARASRGRCMEQIASRQVASGGAYRELHALSDEAASQNAELHAGALFESLGELCGAGIPQIRRAYLDNARMAYVDADRPGPLREQARTAIRRVDAALRR